MQLKKHLILKCALVASLAVIIYGCGFHLRGLYYQIPEAVKVMYIQNDTNQYQFVTELKNILQSSKVTVVDKVNEAKSTLIISNISTTNTQQNITGNLSAGQYLVTYSVTYKVVDSKGRVLLPQQISSASATYSSNATQQLAGNNQANELTSQLQSKVASQIVAALSQIRTVDTSNDNIIIPDDNDSNG